MGKTLKVARQRVKRETGKCGGRKSIKEMNPTVVHVAKRLRRINPKTKRQRSYDKIAMDLFEMDFTNSQGGKFSKCVVMNTCKLNLNLPQDL